jgi:predicted RNA-binding Zn-ribbon protein involved in translation (DUF1610 family)
VSAYTIDHKVTLNVWECPTCGVVYGVTEAFCEQKRNSHQSYYCPNGHSLSWKDSDADILRRKLASAQQDVEWYKARQAEAEGSLRATRGVVTKLRKRVVAGACPFGCRRHFADLERHVGTKHPDAKLEGEAP